MEQAVEVPAQAMVQVVLCKTCRQSYAQFDLFDRAVRISFVLSLKRCYGVYWEYSVGPT